MVIIWINLLPIRIYMDVSIKFKIFACGSIFIKLVTSYFAQKIHFFTQISKNCTAVSFYSNKLKLSNNTDKCIIFNGLKVYFDPMLITCSNSPSQSSQMSIKKRKIDSPLQRLGKSLFLQKAI